MNNEWKKIDLKFYLEYLNFINNYKGDEYFINRLSFLEKINVDDLNTYPIFYIQELNEKWSFLNENIDDLIDENSNEIEIENEVYFIQKDFSFLTMNQWQNIDSILKQSDNDKNYLKNIHILLSICIQNPSDYSYEKALILSEKILKINMFFLTKNINFFLSKDNQLSLNSQLFLMKKMEQKLITNLEVLLGDKTSSIPSGAGIQFYTKFRMRIMLLWIKFYLKKLKK